MNRIDITVTRTIAATPTEVFDVWLDPKKPGSPWFGTAKAVVNATAGGLFYHAVAHEGREWAHYGRFIRLEKAEDSASIEHTWVSEATRGFETVIHLTLKKNGAETVATILHTGVPDDEMGRRHEEGWSYVLGAIADRFAHKK